MEKKYYLQMQGCTEKGQESIKKFCRGYKIKYRSRRDNVLVTNEQVDVQKALHYLD